MAIQVFMLAASDGLYERIYEKEFIHFDESFVVHKFKDGYRVSHKNTGFGVPLSDSDTVDGAMEAAKSIMRVYGLVSFNKTLEKARNIHNELKEKING